MNQPANQQTNKPLAILMNAWLTWNFVIAQHLPFSIKNAGISTSQHITPTNKWWQISFFPSIFVHRQHLSALSSLAAVTLGQDEQLDPLEALANNIPGVPGQVQSTFGTFNIKHKMWYIFDQS